MSARRLTYLILIAGLASSAAAAPAYAGPAPQAGGVAKRALAAFKAGRCVAAIRLYRKSEALQYSPLYTYRIGQCQEFQKNYLAAQQSYQRYLKEYPKHPQNHGGPTAAVVQARLKRLKMKIKLALTRVPLLRRNAVQAFRKGKCKKAITLYRQIMGVKYHPTLDYRIGQCFEFLKKPHLAIGRYQRYLDNYDSHDVVKGQPSKEMVSQRLARLKQAEQATKVDEDLARAALKRSVELMMADGTLKRGVVQGVSATSIILAKRDGVLIKVPLAEVKRLRILKQQPVRPPRVVRQGTVYHPNPAGARRPQGVAQKLKDLKLLLSSATSKRNAGIALAITGAALYIVGGAMYAIKDCVDTGLGDKACSIAPGAWVAAVVFFSMASLAEVVGVSMWIAYGIRTNALRDDIHKLKWGRARTAKQVPLPPRHRDSVGTQNRGAALVLSHQFRF